MKKFLTSTAIAGCLIALGSASAMADCQIIDAERDQARRTDLEQRAAYDTVMTRDLRRLRDAARILDAYGRDSACDAVAEAMREITEDPAEARKVRMERYAEMQNQEGETDVSNPKPKSYEERRMDRINSAKTLTNASIALNANEMIGSDVQNLKGEDVGEIQNLILSDAGEPAYVIVAHGGFLGMGEKLVAVPFGMVKVSADREVYYLPVSDKTLEQAPDFEADAFEWKASADWRKLNDRFYEDHATTEN